MSSESPTKKRPRLDDGDVVEESVSNGKEKMNTVLCLCGAMSPITFMHLRMLGLSSRFHM